MAKLTIVISILLIASTLIDAKHVYLRYKRDLERESDPEVPRKETTVVAQGDDSNEVHKSVKDFTNEIATDERGGKDFFELDYNPEKDLFKFYGHLPQIFRSRHMQLFEQMMKQMLSQTQQMFQNFPMHSISNEFPENYNGTRESEITIGGRRFRKKERIVNKATDNTMLSFVSTVYEPIEDVDGDITTLQPNKDGVTEGPIISY